MKTLILSSLLLLSPVASAESLFLWGCGGGPWTHIKWSVYVPDGYTTKEAWELRDSIWRVEKELNSPDCVWVDDVSIEGEADRFTEVRVSIDTNATSFDYSVDRGSVRRYGRTLFVRGDGEADYGMLTLNITGFDEEYLIPFREEPRCGVEASRDCLGYRQYGGWDLIYYGEEDTRVVDVELIVTRYKYINDEPVQVFEGREWDKMQQRVAKYNETMKRNAIHINWVLKELWEWNNTDLRRGEDFVRSRPGDIGLGREYTYPQTCGVAYPNRTFEYAGFGFSRCGETVDLHELGHVVGLAHGPNNLSNPGNGYVFPDFGHGGYNQCGSKTDDIMSYGSKDHFFNSLQDCDEVFPGRYYVGPAGDRNRADSAYHWNRIRFDLSLIHDERAQKSPARARQLVLPADDLPLIID